MTPSGFEGGDFIKMSAIFATVANEVQLNNGTFIHACFETIDWIDKTVPDKKKLLDQLKPYEPMVDDMGKLVNQFYAMLERPNLKMLLSKQYYVEKHQSGDSRNEIQLKVSNERPFAISLDGELMHGSIDRLIEVRKNDKLVAVEIVDFKTDAISSGILNEKVKHYLPQMNAYRKAVSKFCSIPWEQVSTKLAFVNKDVIVDCEHDEKSIASDCDEDRPANNDSGAKNVTSPKRPNFIQKQQLKLWSDD